MYCLRIIEDRFQRKKVLVCRHVSNDDDSCTSDFDSAVYYLQSAEFGWYVCAADFTALFGQAFFIYQIMQFMVGIPKELDESAIIDGCSKYSVFTKIIFPLLKPSIITTIIIQFYWKWDDFMGPLIYLNKPRSYTVSIAIKLFADAGSSTTYASMFAMSTLSLLPVFLIFLFFNKYLVQGISTSGLKG